MTRRLPYALLIVWILLATGCTARIVGTFAGQPVSVDVQFPVGGSGGTTPTQTAQPTATLPATNTPTLTPSATAVQTEPATPTQQGTPVVTPGPTNTTVPATPLPTSYPTACWGRVNTSVANVRGGPSTSFAIVGKAYRLDILYFDGHSLDQEGKTWYRISSYWDDTGEKKEAWVRSDLIAPDESAVCWATSIVPKVQQGFHLLQTVNIGALQPLFSRIGTLKAVSPWLTDVLKVAKQSNPDLITVYRATSAGDCPPLDRPIREWLDRLSAFYWPGERWYIDYFEYQNECIAPVEWWIASSIEAMQWANERGICLLLFSFSVGHPPVEYWQQFKPVFEFAANHPCRPGMLHGVALHAYTVYQPVFDVWLFSRWRTLYGSVAVEDRALYETIPLYITEMGDDPQTMAGQVDCGNYWRFVGEARQALEGTIIDGYHLWNVGSGTGWIDIGSCLGGWPW